jgi:hypothetical protein
MKENDTYWIASIITDGIVILTGISRLPEKASRRKSGATMTSRPIEEVGLFKDVIV